MRRDFALLNRDVHDLVQPRAISDCVNMRHAALHLAIGDDPSELEFHTDLVQTERRHIGNAAQREKNLFTQHAGRLALMLKKNLLLISQSPCVRELSVRMHGDAFPPEHIFQHGGGIRIHFVQDMRTALDQSDLDAEPREELREFQRHRTAAQHNNRARKPRHFERGVTGQKTNVIQLGQGRGRNRRPGGDHKMFRRQFSAGAQLNRMRVTETRHCANEFELSGGELPRATIGEILDHRIFPRHDLREIKIDLRPNAPRLGMAGQMHHFRRVQQRLGRHATAQNAQPAQFIPAFDDNGLETGCGSRSRRGISAAAAADYRHIKIMFVVRLHPVTIAHPQTSHIIKKDAPFARP